ncbi:MAG: c-type cytochrome [Moraxellaceae bacterium]
MMQFRQRMSILIRPITSAAALCALLSLSACSSESTDAESAASNQPTDTPVMEEEATVTESETVTPEPVTEADSVSTVAVFAETTPAEDEAEQQATADAAAMALPADAGVMTYETNCQVCHAAGLLDAPKYGDQAAWAPRLAKGTQTLYLHSVQGFNKMPPQATDKVSEAQVHAAVDYMIDAVN